MRLLAAAGGYFALVFAAGFLLGVIRSLWIAPRLGARRAEILEAPLMVAISWLAARALVPAADLGTGLPERLRMGAVALVLMLGAELLLVRPLRGVSVRQYLAARDRWAAGAYYLALLAFALMPAVA